jgi:hypothetical protein
MIFFFGFYFPAMMLFDLVEDMFVDGGNLSTVPIRLSAIFFLQLSLNCGYCFYRLGKFFCLFSPPCAIIEKSRLVYWFFGSINKTIIYNLLLSLIMYCIFSFGFVVGVSSLLLFNLM